MKIRQTTNTTYDSCVCARWNGGATYTDYQLRFSVWSFLYGVVFGFDVVHEHLIYSPDNCLVLYGNRALLCSAHRNHRGASSSLLPSLGFEIPEYHFQNNPTIPAPLPSIITC